MTKGKLAGFERPLVEDCSIGFNLIVEVEDMETLLALEEEIEDNIKARLNTAIEEDSNRAPVTEVMSIQAAMPNQQKIAVDTNLRLFSDDLEHIMIDEIQAELKRVTDGDVKEKSYEYTV